MIEAATGVHDAAVKAGVASAGSKKGAQQQSARRLNDALQVLVGPLMASRGLRYKKKMWSFRISGVLAPCAAYSAYTHIEKFANCWD